MTGAGLVSVRNRASKVGLWDKSDIGLEKRKDLNKKTVAHCS